LTARLKSCPDTNHGLLAARVNSCPSRLWRGHRAALLHL
jgi:hypothetical protein